MTKSIISFIFSLFLILGSEETLAQEFVTTTPSQTSPPAVLKYKDVDLMPKEINGLYFYESPEDGRLGYYLIQVFFDENLKITASEEIYAVPDRKNLNNRDVYKVYYIINDIVGYLSGKIEASPNGKYYTVSHTVKEGKEYLCAVDVYKNNKQIDSYKLDPQNYEDFKFWDLEISNSGEISIWATKREKKVTNHFIFTLTENGLEEKLISLNDSYRYSEFNIIYNNLNELFAFGPYINPDKKKNDKPGGIVVLKIDNKDEFTNYIPFDIKEFNPYQAKDNTSQLKLAPNGDIIYVSPNTYCIDGTYNENIIYSSPNNSGIYGSSTGENIDIMSFSESGEFQFLQRIDRKAAGFGFRPKTMVTENGIYIFYNNYKDEDYETSKVCKINYAGEIEFNKRFIEENVEHICTPSFVQKLTENQFVYYLFVKKDNIRILEIVE